MGDEEEKIILDENEKETKTLPDEKSDASIEAVRDNETIEVQVEQKQKEPEVPSSPEQEICIEKEELESNEKFSKENVTFNQSMEDSAQIRIKSDETHLEFVATEPKFEEETQKEELKEE